MIGLASSSVRSLGGLLVQRLITPDGNEVIVTRPERADCLDSPPPVAPRTGSLAFRCGYTAVHPLTVAGAPTDTVWTYVGASPLAYWAALCGWWEDAVAEGCGLAVFEHDVVCRPDIVEAFETRPDPWLSAGYFDVCCKDPAGWSDDNRARWAAMGSPEGWSPCLEGWADHLGMTRFSAQLVAAVPDAPHRIPADNRDWHLLCGGSGSRPVVGLGDILRAEGFEHSWYFPSAVHHHQVQAPTESS
jgi:hypothetical protein